LAFRLIKLSVSAAAVGVVAVTGLGGLNLYTYQRFTHEQPIASLSFEQLGPERFNATLMPVGEEPRTYELQGDEWQLDVRMIKWTDWLTFLGEDPLFRFDRLSGRYSNVEAALQGEQTLHALTTASGFDVWEFARESGEWLPGVDAAYGSSVFLPMLDGLRYEVSLSATGLLARPLPVGDTQ
jgi:hypothetical protein